MAHSNFMQEVPAAVEEVDPFDEMMSALVGNRTINPHGELMARRQQSGFLAPDDPPSPKYTGVEGDITHKFKLFWKHPGESDDIAPREETYEQRCEDPVQWSKDIIEWFNSTLRPHERKRVFIRCEVIGEVPPAEQMVIDFPNHRVGAWLYTPLLLRFKGRFRRQHWRWTVDHCGCCCTYYWQYSDHPSELPLETAPENLRWA